MINPDSHLWLYAKRHYVENLMMADLKVIVGARNAMEPDMIRDGDVVEVLLGIVVPLLLKQNEYCVSQFLRELRPEEAWKFARKWRGVVPTSDELLVAKCLSLMSLAIVRENGVTRLRLDPVDPNLLGVSFVGDGKDALPLSPATPVSGSLP